MGKGYCEGKRRGGKDLQEGDALKEGRERWAW